MKGLLFTIFEELDILSLSEEECRDCLYYIDALLDQEESPENFIRYQLTKMKIEIRLREIIKNENFQ